MIFFLNIFLKSLQEPHGAKNLVSNLYKQAFYLVHQCFRENTANNHFFHSLLYDFARKTEKKNVRTKHFKNMIFQSTTDIFHTF